jgi:hypothetical protein
MRIRLGELRKIIFEVLEEAEGGAPRGGPPYHELEDDSLDVKLDNYFVDSENGGKEDMGESWLREAEDDPPTPQGREAPAGAEVPKGPDISKEEMKIDAAGFARDVAHLIENFTNLMDVKGIVLRRALNYVGKKYGKEQSKTVKDVLETQFGVYSDEKEEPQAPGAANAGPALAG